MTHDITQDKGQHVVSAPSEFVLETITVEQHPGAIGNLYEAETLDRVLVQCDANGRVSINDPDEDTHVQGAIVALHYFGQWDQYSREKDRVSLAYHEYHDLGKPRCILVERRYTNGSPRREQTMG